MRHIGGLGVVGGVVVGGVVVSGGCSGRGGLLPVPPMRFGAHPLHERFPILELNLHPEIECGRADGECFEDPTDAPGDRERAAELRLEGERLRERVTEERTRTHQ